MVLSGAWRHLALGIALILLGMAWFAAPASAQSETPCDEKFPEQDWQLVQAGSGVTTYRAALDEGIATRFGDNAQATADLLAGDLGSFQPMTLCVFGSETALDGTELETAGLLPPGQRLHAAAFRDDALLFIDAQQFRLVGDAIALGVAEIALWHISGGEGYPEPLAGAVAQWYAARQDPQKAERNRSTMRVFSFFDDPTGTAPPAPWLDGVQDPIAVWNPEFQDSPVGDLVATAVAANGVEILIDPDPDEWAAADIAWRAGLREELLQGADRSREWVGGVMIAVLVVLAGIAMAWWGRRVNKRKQKPMGEIAVIQGSIFDRSSPETDE
ncbi:MAG: hypothetical protein HKN91_14700 [Acidimicrobiia bacterium]|nr:hypothetical protein [Acidimicrobiia bacterium]